MCSTVSPSAGGLKLGENKISPPDDHGTETAALASSLVCAAIARFFGAETIRGAGSRLRFFRANSAAGPLESVTRTLPFDGRSFGTPLRHFPSPGRNELLVGSRRAKGFQDDLPGHAHSTGSRPLQVGAAPTCQGGRTPVRCKDRRFAIARPIAIPNEDYGEGGVL